MRRGGGRGGGVHLSHGRGRGWGGCLGCVLTSRSSGVRHTLRGEAVQVEHITLTPCVESTWFQLLESTSLSGHWFQKERDSTCCARSYTEAPAAASPASTAEGRDDDAPGAAPSPYVLAPSFDTEVGAETHQHTPGYTIHKHSRPAPPPPPPCQRAVVVLQPRRSQTQALSNPEALALKLNCQLEERRKHPLFCFFINKILDP